MHYDFDFSVLAGHTDALLHGLGVTLVITLGANLIGITLGFVLCMLVMNRLAVISVPAKTFIEFFRCTPVLIQIVWFFYCTPLLFNVYFGPIFTGVLALGLNLVAFNAEAYRAGVQAVPKAHMDSSVALGLTSLQRTIYVVLPQALRHAVPVLMTNGITILQQSALVAIVAIPDLMYQGQSLATTTYRPVEVYSVVALIYLAMALPISSAVERLEARFSAPVGR